jgi:hypothetical protein
MKIGPTRWAGLKPHTRYPDSVRFEWSQSQKAQLAKTVRRHLRNSADLEEFLANASACVRAYRIHVIDGKGADAKLQPKKKTEAELTALLDAAKALEDAIYALSAETRARLSEDYRLMAKPSWWKGDYTSLVPGVLLSTALDAATIYKSANDELVRVRKERQPRGRPINYAAHELSVQLAMHWRRYTGKLPTRGRGNGSPWEQFLCDVFALASVGVTGEKLARDAAPWIESYERTWGPIEVRPEARRT